MQATVRKLGQRRWHQACTWYSSAHDLSYHILLSGNAVFSLNDDLLLVDNLVDGFDLYQYPRTSPSESFHIPREKAYVHGCAFVGGELVACGSDHGLVYLYSVDTGQSVGKLWHGSRNAMIQVIEVYFNPPTLLNY
jgi:WD40 repeat protein